MAWTVQRLALFYIIGAVVLGGHGASALCRCAETFPTLSDLNDTSYAHFDPSQGETWVFSSMRFLCRGATTKVTYRADYRSCRCNCDCPALDNSVSGDLPPEIQLWRKNDTTYLLNNTISLVGASQEVVLEWAFEKDDLVGLWIPSGNDECSCSTQEVLKVRYLYQSSKVYKISGYVSYFDTEEVGLSNAPMPMLIFDTDPNLELECLIGGSVGVAIFLVLLCMATIVIICSANRVGKKNTIKGILTINPETHAEEERETEMRSNNIRGEISGVPNFENDAVYEELPDHAQRATPQLPGLMMANRYTQENRPQSAASHASSHAHYRPPSSSTLPQQHSYRQIPRQMSQESVNRTPSPTHLHSSASYPHLASTQPQPHMQAHPNAQPQPHMQAHPNRQPQPHMQAHPHAQPQPHMQALPHAQPQPHMQAHPNAQPPLHTRLSPPIIDDFDFNATIQQLEAEANSLEDLAAEADRRDGSAMLTNNFSLHSTAPRTNYENVDPHSGSNSNDSTSSGTEYEETDEDEDDDDDDDSEDGEDVYMN